MTLIILIKIRYFLFWIISLNYFNIFQAYQIREVMFSLISLLEINRISCYENNPAFLQLEQYITKYMVYMIRLAIRSLLVASSWREILLCLLIYFLSPKFKISMKNGSCNDIQTSKPLWYICDFKKNFEDPFTHYLNMRNIILLYKEYALKNMH